MRPEPCQWGPAERVPRLQPATFALAFAIRRTLWRYNMRMNPTATANYKLHLSEFSRRDDFPLPGLKGTSMEGSRAGRRHGALQHGEPDGAHWDGAMRNALEWCVLSSRAINWIDRGINSF